MRMSEIAYRSKVGHRITGRVGTVVAIPSQVRSGQTNVHVDVLYAGSVVPVPTIVGDLSPIVSGYRGRRIKF